MHGAGSWDTLCMLERNEPAWLKHMGYYLHIRHAHVLHMGALTCGAYTMEKHGISPGHVTVYFLLMHLKLGTLSLAESVGVACSAFGRSAESYIACITFSTKPCLDTSPLSFSSTICALRPLHCCRPLRLQLIFWCVSSSE
eukprot:TRINITY_DN1157_c0_g2_i2.p3 TRINITY_DN1157_c0_g2~~TRINITY_DN1157_c0_g2_i2.p3  ORF type:complete len:141 (-),score=5.38 TRINITY_DN1157_c0_g2_i2:529-951(-)